MGSDRGAGGADGGRRSSAAGDGPDRLPAEGRSLAADRVASMAMLAAAVVHELNDPLGYTIANVGYALEALREMDDDLAGAGGGDAPDAGFRLARARATVRTVVEALREARQGGDRTRLILRDLKLFSGSDDERRAPVDVRRVLESSINMAYGEIRHRARLVKDYAPVPLVDGNEARLGQVFLNLLVNAAQAIREGDVEHQQIRVVARTGAGGECVVEVSDTGRGIPAPHLPRLFDPFFTTKPKGGTGLGLSICRSLVTAMGGEISVESTPGQGSTFRVVLPAALEAAVAPTSPPAADARSVPRGRVLVVDDEPMMARAVQRLLEGEYDVVTTSDPREAVEDVVAHGARFDAILCDLMMPTLTGMEVFEAIARAAPEQARRMIFMTGGAFTPRAAQFLEQVENQRLEKPLQHAALRAVLRPHMPDRR